jgi:hypothetical protein
MNILLNRWRGTKAINAKLYAAVIGLIVGWYFGVVAGIITAIVFVAGESFGWGEWIGGIISESTRPVPNTPEAREEGARNGIRWLANKVVSEDVDYAKHIRVALAIRGIYWWVPVMGTIAFFSGAYWLVAIGVIAGVLFPVAFDLATKYDDKIPTIRCKWFHVEGRWEKGEVIYGLFLDVLMAVSVIGFLIA